MKLDLTEDQIGLRDGIERLCADAARDADSEAARGKLWADLARMGWLGLATPEDRDGIGGSPFDAGLAMRAAGRHGLVTPFLSSIIMAGRVLGLAPASPTADAVLADAIAGTVRLALAHQEGEDFDPAQPATQARKTPDGWRLSGAKVFSFGAADADWLVVSASLAGSPALFLLPARAEGVTCVRHRSLRGEDFADVVMDVALPADALLVQGPAAAALASRVVDEATLALCWEAVGAMTALFEQTLAYVKVREQFGRPIAVFQTVQHRIAEMAVHCEEAQSIVELASLKAGGAERGLFASVAKAQVGRAARYVSETAVQLHGGVGVTEELQVARYFRLLLAFQAMLGTTDRRLTRYAAAAIPARTHEKSAVLG